MKLKQLEIGNNCVLIDNNEHSMEIGWRAYNIIEFFTMFNKHAKFSNNDCAYVSNLIEDSKLTKILYPEKK